MRRTSACILSSLLTKNVTDHQVKLWKVDRLAEEKVSPFFPR
jgi:hypothetical protein